MLFFFCSFFGHFQNKRIPLTLLSLGIICPTCSFLEATEVPTGSFWIEKKIVFKEQYNNDIRTKAERTEKN